MSRSSTKPPFIDPKLLKKATRAKETGSVEPIKTWSRDSEISPEMVGLTFAVHNGKDFISVRVGEDMIGHHLGEFSLTRKFTRHGGKLQKTVEGGAQAPPPAK